MNKYDKQSDYLQYAEGRSATPRVIHEESPSEDIIHYISIAMVVLVGISADVTAVQEVADANGNREESAIVCVQHVHIIEHSLAGTVVQQHLCIEVAVVFEVGTKR